MAFLCGFFVLVWFFNKSKTPGLRVLNRFLMNGIVGSIKLGSVKTGV